MTNLAKRIKEGREHCGLNKNQMADKLGISAQFYGRIEAGYVGLPIDKLGAFSRLTGESVNGLIEEILKDERVRLRKAVAK